MISNREECFELSREIIDRFGPYPEPIEKLMALLEIRVLCQLLHIGKAKINNRELLLTLLPTTPLNNQILTPLFSETFKIISEFKIGILLDRKGWKSDCKIIINYLKNLSQSFTSIET